MTDQSRVEAVARAIAIAAAKREFGPRYEGYESSHRELGEEFAQAAIEANDAWLKARGWKAVPQEATERMLVEGACCMPPTPENSISYSCWEPGNSTMREEASDDWRRMWNEAPSPEEPDK